MPLARKKFLPLLSLLCFRQACICGDGDDLLSQFRLIHGAFPDGYHIHLPLRLPILQERIIWQSQTRKIGISHQKDQGMRLINLKVEICHWTLLQYMIWQHTFDGRKKPSHSQQMAILSLQESPALDVRDCKRMYATNNYIRPRAMSLERSL